MGLLETLQRLWPFSPTQPDTAGDIRPQPGDRASFAACARRTYDGMRYHFATAVPGLYHPRYLVQRGDQPYAYHWPQTQALTAELDIAHITGAQGQVMPRCLEGLDPYWDADPAWGLPGYASAVLPLRGPGGDKYYDDNAWAGLLLTRVYRTTGDEQALRQAEAVFDFVTDGWADQPVCQTQPASGGIFWKQQTPSEAIHDRNTVSNAPNAELGLLLHQISGTPDTVDRARRIYDWVNANLRDASDGLYWDHIGIATDGACTVEPTKWSYNQGTMVGANVLLHRLTGERHYLEQAQAIADAALRHYGCTPRMTADSPLFRQGPAFNAIFFRNLLLLASVDGNPAYREALESYAIMMWNNDGIRRITRAGTVFTINGIDVDLLDQATMTQLYACLAWDPADYGEIV